MAHIEPYDANSLAALHGAGSLSHLPVLRLAIGPYKLATIVTELRHTLCTQE
jgi:preprotein translocase subunit SecY